LDAGDERGFREAMRGLGVLGRDLFDLTSAEGDAFRFYLSGGFKAAIPYLIGLAEGLRSLPGPRQVDAFVLHDTAPRSSAPIKLPLRHMNSGLVDQQLEGFKNGWQRRPPAPAFLEGYAYETTESGCKLTAFGEGLRVLFPPRAEGL
jgi:hypothetical protein